MSGRDGSTGRHGTRECGHCGLGFDRFRTGRGFLGFGCLAQGGVEEGSTRIRLLVDMGRGSGVRGADYRIRGHRTEHQIRFHCGFWRPFEFERDIRMANCRLVIRVPCGGMGRNWGRRKRSVAENVHFQCFFRIQEFGYPGMVFFVQFVIVK